MIAVVGKGIVGLSVAEFLSRNGNSKVTVVFSPEQIPASLAAAANLATKAQVYARDPHFALKLQGKRLYPRWLEMLIKESKLSWKVEELFQCGAGRDIFESEELAEKQWHRIFQDPSELLARGLASQGINRIDNRTIEYADEAWVDAGRLLQLLEIVCRLRGVEFVEADVGQADCWPHLLSSVQSVVLCAGSGTPEILKNWNCHALPSAFSRSLRWSYGGTLTLRDAHRQWQGDLALFEIVGSGIPSKVTLSGVGKTLYASSVSVPCRDENHPDVPAKPDLRQLERQKLHIVSVLNSFGISPTAAQSLEWKWGFRLGFGHSELVVASLPHDLPFLNGPLIVAAGVHKSGFLFAPVLGEQVMQKLQQRSPRS